MDCADYKHPGDNCHWRSATSLGEKYIIFILLLLLLIIIVVIIITMTIIITVIIIMVIILLVTIIIVVVVIVIIKRLPKRIKGEGYILASRAKRHSPGFHTSSPWSQDLYHHRCRRLPHHQSRFYFIVITTTTAPLPMTTRSTTIVFSRVGHNHGLEKSW